MKTQTSRHSPDLEDDVSRSLEQLVVQADTGGGDTLEGSPGEERDVTEESGEKAIVPVLPDTDLHPQPHLALALPLHRQQVAAEQEGVEDLLPCLVGPEPGQVLCSQQFPQ